MLEPPDAPEEGKAGHLYVASQAAQDPHRAGNWTLKYVYFRILEVHQPSLPYQERRPQKQVPRTVTVVEDEPRCPVNPGLCPDGAER